MPPARPLITLLTDFGDRDYFVASMKGVILSIRPDAAIVDLSHQISPYRIAEAGFVLVSCYRTFPPGTIHVAVVDPGVGSSRRPLVVATSRYYFLAPDNGLLSLVLNEEDQVEVREIENAKYRIVSPGATFDGRDLFAPAAAWLAKDEPVANFGRLVTDPVILGTPGPEWRNRLLAGQVVYIDRFGNLISNLTTAHLSIFRDAVKRPPVIRVAGRTIERLVESYSQGSPQSPSALVNSNGYLEVFLKEGNAAQSLASDVGIPVTLE